MFNLLVRGGGWDKSPVLFDSQRVFEYTEKKIEKLFKPKGILNIEKVMRLPTIFASEGKKNQLARVGSINQIEFENGSYRISFFLDLSLPPIQNSELFKEDSILNFHSFQPTRTHWAIKDVDIFKFLYQKKLNKNPSPKVFSIDELNAPEENLVAVMMPFDSSFNPVYSAIKNSIEDLDLDCCRADDMWQNEQIMQDIVSLICKSSVVICDCTGRNPNVFYEAGIAHALGKNVILLAQHESDVPFDLRHLRYLKYLNNEEGLLNMTSSLKGRVSKLIFDD